MIIPLNYEIVLSYPIRR